MENVDGCDGVLFYSRVLHSVGRIQGEMADIFGYSDLGYICVSSSDNGLSDEMYGWTLYTLLVPDLFACRADSND